MGRVVALREDFDGPGLRGLAKASKDSNQIRRLLALAEIYDGGRRKDAARIGAVGLQVIRDWVLRFNARGPDGLIDGKAPGKPPKLNDEQRRALARIVESGPIPAIRRINRCNWLVISVTGCRSSMVQVAAPRRWPSGCEVSWPKTANCWPAITCFPSKTITKLWGWRNG